MSEDVNKIKKIVSEIKVYKISYDDLYDELKNNHEVVLAALFVLDDIFSTLDERLRANKKIAMSAINNSVDNIKYIAESLKKDKKFLMSVIEKNGFNKILIENIDKEILEDKDFVLELVKKNNVYYDCLSQNMKNDIEIISEVVKKGGCKSIDSNILNNRENLEFFLNSGYYIDLRLINENLRKDKNIIEKIILSSWANIDYMDNDFKNDKDFMLKLLIQNNNIQSHLSEDLKNDKDFIVGLLKNQLSNRLVFAETIGDSLWNEYEVLELIINRNFSYSTEIKIINKIVENNYLEKIVNNTELTNSGKVKILRAMNIIPQYKELLEDEKKNFYTYKMLLENDPLIIEKIMNNYLKKQLQETIVQNNSNGKRLKF